MYDLNYANTSEIFNFGDLYPCFEIANMVCFKYAVHVKLSTSYLCSYTVNLHVAMKSGTN